MRKGEPVLGITEMPNIPGAPKLGEHAYLRHLFRTLEAQRNVALSAVAELAARFETMKEQYGQHVQELVLEVTTANTTIARQAEELRTLRASIPAPENVMEPKAPDNVIPKSKRAKRVDK